MSDHYYSTNPQSQNVTETNDYIVRNHSFTFTSASGVFSKKGIDFGTRLLIETFEIPEVEGAVLDLGCGYGPIGITLAYHYEERSFVMVDVNERAISLAKKNANQNNSTNVVIKQSDGFTNIAEQSFAAIITNPPIRAGKKVINRLFAESSNHLVNGGELWIVVQKKQGAPSVIKYLQSIFHDVDVVTRKKGYYIICAKN
ncbi:class I SAM-dependent methyltransferase [Pseudogracilibacillus auburnensis]|uniref:16S rRNA m(2)G 1207 methyltransferase n=1 Tax=Pseudogracilibacillus auburnensis TaxID=1494959 RepID=A0A2V3VSL2_9BACI|nr:class I SAM-dependent methyltransferase [Pseudogracilibacillus auburnensis]PXW84892.1 16S rRNA m(2)G 1207 methyltransferase [Pseudogracilibacillus auburnensis]